MGSLKNKNFVMLLTVGIVAVAVLVIALIGGQNQKEEAAPEVETTAVSKGDVVQEVDASGTVESEKKKTFFSPVNAVIQSMTAQAGDSVEAGEALISFNLETLEADNQKAELNIRAGQLDLQDAQEQAAQAEAKIAEARGKIPGLESAIAEKQDYISSLRQQMSDAQAEAIQAASDQAAEAQRQAEEAYAQAQTQYETEILPQYQEELSAREQKKYEEQAKYNEAKQAYEKGELPVDEYSEAEKLFQQAEQAYEEYKAQQPEAPKAEAYLVPTSDESVPTVDTTWLEAEMETASQDLAQLQSDLASQEAIAEADTASLTNAAKDKMKISNNLSELEAKNIQELLEEGRKGVQAEFKGVISSAQVTQGATVSQGMELFTLQSTEEVCVEANISKYDFDKVKEGQRAVVTLGDQEYQGTVTQINKIAIANEKGTPMIGVRVHIDNPDDGIFIGVEAKVRIQAAEAKAVNVLPVGVVNIGKDGSFCYAVEDGVIVKRSIETGISSDTMVEVKSGLKEGDQVLQEIGNYEEGDAVRTQENVPSE